MENTISEIGISEFRNDLSKHLSTEMPLAVTDHGKTVGYYIPVHADFAAEDFKALKEAARKMALLLAENNITEDEIVADFRLARKGKRVE